MSTNDSCASPGRFGANSSGTFVPASSSRMVAMSTTDVPIPVPTLNARASSNPTGGSGFVAPYHIASATSPT